MILRDDSDSGGMVRQGSGYLPVRNLAVLPAVTSVTLPPTPFQKPESVFAAVVANTIRPLADEKPAPPVLQELTQEQQLQNTTSNKVKAMDKLKAFITANAWRALIIGVVAGIAGGIVYCKKFGKKGWK